MKKIMSYLTLSFVLSSYTLAAKVEVEISNCPGTIYTAPDENVCLRIGSDCSMRTTPGSCNKKE